MANDRLYLTLRSIDGDPACILLAKGWESGWEVWDEATLGIRLMELLAKFHYGDEIAVEQEAKMKGPAPDLIRSNIAG